MDIRRRTSFHYPYLNVSKPENAISWNQQIDHIAWRNNPYMNVSKPPNTIPEYQQIEVLSSLYCSFLIVSCLKKGFLSISKWTSLLEALHTFHRFPPWNHYTWTSAKRRSCSWYCNCLNVSRPENVIPDNQQIDTLQFHTVHIWTFCSLKKEFVNMSRTTNFQDSTTHIWTFRSLKSRLLRISKSTT